MKTTGGNLEADASGKAHLELTDTMMTMSGEESIIGRSVIVHEKEDDLKSQPVGNAVSDQAETKAREHDGDAREERDPPVRSNLVGAVLDNVPPAGSWLSDPNAKVGKTGLQNYHVANSESRSYNDRRNDVW